MGRYYQGDIEGKFWFGIQSSDDANYFGGSEIELQDDETGYVYELEYFFAKEDLETINEGIQTCITDLGEFKEKLDEFFKDSTGYNPDELAKHLGVDVIEYRELMVSYARLHLGEKIKKCVGEKGECRFTAEL
jgi:hypothetical protein|tara:strand:- start:122 stop:520 length:399 start_codon:yes stop_codon:yes gene_type:complete